MPGTQKHQQQQFDHIIMTQEGADSQHMSQADFEQMLIQAASEKGNMNQQQIMSMLKESRSLEQSRNLEASKQASSKRHSTQNRQKTVEDVAESCDSQ